MYLSKKLLKLDVDIKCLVQNDISGESKWLKTKLMYGDTKFTESGECGTLQFGY